MKYLLPLKVYRTKLTLHFMMTSFLLIIVINPLFFCKKSINRIKDHTTIIVGLTKDKQTQNLLNDVVVGFRIIGVSDSMLFLNDSICSYNSDNVKFATQTVNGRFKFQRFLGDWPPNYDNMFAFKKDYFPWRFDNNRDTIFHLRSHMDSINIYLELNR